jgi:small subunit ribosomal protein S21
VNLVIATNGTFDHMVTDSPNCSNRKKRAVSHLAHLAFLANFTRILINYSTTCYCFAVQSGIRLLFGQCLQLFAATNQKGTVNHMQVSVRDNNVDQALRALKKKLQREGVFREMKLKQHFEKPSEKKARNKAEAIRRARKLARKKLEREG